MFDAGASIRKPPVSIAETLSGAPGIVDLWYYTYERGDDQALRAAQESLMSAEERDRCRAYRFERDQRMFVATRALVRTVLSGYSSVAPADWRFETGSHGKPRVSGPTVSPPLHFNLANTAGLVVCAVSVAHEAVGVDAERIDRRADVLGVAERYFSKAESAALRALPESERLGRFLGLWTLKESYIKARGLGLSQALGQFSFLLGSGPVSIAFDDRVADDAARWRFSLLELPPHHTVAVAADTAGAAMRVRSSPIVPLSKARTG